MPRLFITPREQNLISDLTKEIVKDVNGQKIYYYPISELKTKAHTLYNESPEKVFDSPLSIDAFVGVPEATGKIDQFTYDQEFRLEAYVQYRDLADKNINMTVGDFFSYGSVLYEIADVNPIKPIFGQVEHVDGLKVTAYRAREGQLKVKVLGPTLTSRTDADAIQTDFDQQRGFAENQAGPTGDKRDLQENGVLDKPLTGPQEVSVRGDKTNSGNAFYDEG